MGHPVTFPVPGAKSTVLAPAKVGEFGIEFATVAGWLGANLDEDGVKAATRRLASGWLRRVKPELVRNSKKVVEYAVLQSATIPVSAVVFAPEFAKQLEDVFGPGMKVVIPNRHTVFVFPAVAVDYSVHAPMVLEAWRSSAPKASLEVFEVGEGGLKAVGRFEEP